MRSLLAAGFVLLVCVQAFPASGDMVFPARLEVIEVEQIPGLPVPEQPRDRTWDHDDRARPVGTFAMWGSGLRADTLNLSLSDPEVAIIEGAALPQGVLENRSNLGGMTFGYRVGAPAVELGFVDLRTGAKIGLVGG